MNIRIPFPDPSGLYSRLRAIVPNQGRGLFSLTPPTVIPIPPPPTGWAVLRDTTSPGSGFVSDMSFHGFQWGVAWSDDSQFVTCATGEGDVGLFRTFVGAGSNAIATTGFVNAGEYFYMDDCDEANNVLAATGNGGFLTACVASTMATLFQDDFANASSALFLASDADARKVFINSTGTRSFYVVSMNPGIIATVSPSTGKLIALTSAVDSWDEGSGLTIFTADFDRTRNLLFASNGNGYLFNCSTTTPTLAFTSNVTATFACAIHGNRLYTHDCNSGFGTKPGNIMVWDVTTPTLMHQIAEYAVPTSGPGSHISNAVYNQLCISNDGNWLFGAWGSPGNSGIDVMATALVTGTTSAVSFTALIPTLDSPPSGANLNGNAIGYTPDGFGMKVSPNNLRLAVEWGSGGSASGAAGVTVYDISNKNAITPTNFIGTGAETKSSIIDASGNILVAAQYNFMLHGSGGTLNWVSLPQIGSFGGFRLSPYVDLNTWLCGGHQSFDTSVWRTNGSSAPTLLRDYNNGGGGGALGITVFEQWDGHNLQVINTAGVANGWGLQIFNIGPYVSDTANNNYEPTLKDTWVDSVTFPPSQSAGSGALYIDGQYGTANAKTWLSDQSFGVVVIGTATPSQLTRLMHDPIISSNSPNAASFGAPTQVVGSTLEVGNSDDIYVFYPLYFKDTACTQPLGWLPYVYNSSNPSQPPPIDMTGFAPGNNWAITIQLQNTVGAKGFRVYGFKNPYGNPSFGYIPLFTGVSLTNASGIPYPASVNITTPPSSWAGAMPVPLGSPGFTAATVAGGALGAGTSYTGAVVYRDQFNTVVGWDYGNWVTLAGGQNAISVSLPGSGSGLTPATAVTQELWMFLHRPGITVNGPFEDASAQMATEVGVVAVAQTAVTVTGPTSSWGSNANNPIAFTYQFAQWRQNAFSAAFGTSSITSVGSGSTRRIVVGLGDYGARIYNPTTLLQTGSIQGFFNGGQSFAGHSVVKNRYTVSQNYTSAALVGEGGFFAYDHNPPNQDNPLVISKPAGVSTIGFSCWGGDSAYAGITWFTPQGVVLVNTLSGPILVQAPS